jgi:hypothetical protein
LIRVSFLMDEYKKKGRHNQEEKKGQKTEANRESLITGRALFYSIRMVGLKRISFLKLKE